MWSLTLFPTVLDCGFSIVRAHCYDRATVVARSTTVNTPNPTHSQVSF